MAVYPHKKQNKTKTKNFKQNQILDEYGETLPSTVDLQHYKLNHFIFLTKERR